MKTFGRIHVPVLRVSLFIALVVSGSTLSSVAAASDEPPAQNPKPALKSAPRLTEHQIKKVRAYLYYHETGTFDDRDILSGKVVLRNIFTGGGDALEKSGVTLVMVDIEGPGTHSRPPIIYVNIEAHETYLGALGSIRVRLDTFLSGKKLISVPAIFYGGFCGDLTITASLEGIPSSKPLSATAHFTCGE
jgi:hypothetical protein